VTKLVVREERPAIQDKEGKIIALKLAASRRRGESSNRLQKSANFPNRLAKGKPRKGRILPFAETSDKNQWSTVMKNKSSRKITGRRDAIVEINPLFGSRFVKSHSEKNHKNNNN